MKNLLLACVGLLGLCPVLATASPDDARRYDARGSRRAAYHESRDDEHARDHSRHHDRVIIQELGGTNLYLTDGPPHPYHHHHSHGRVNMPPPGMS